MCSAVGAGGALASVGGVTAVPLMMGAAGAGLGACRGNSRRALSSPAMLLGGKPDLAVCGEWGGDSRWGFGLARLHCRDSVALVHTVAFPPLPPSREMDNPPSLGEQLFPLVRARGAGAHKAARRIAGVSEFEFLRLGEGSGLAVAIAVPGWLAGEETILQQCEWVTACCPGCVRRWVHAYTSGEGVSAFLLILQTNKQNTSPGL